MKILILSPEAVYPPNTGGRIVVYNKIKYLKELGNDVILLNVVDSDEELILQKQKLSDMGIEVYSFNRGNRKIVNVIKSLILPFSVASRTAGSIRKQCQKIIKNSNVDFIFVEFPQMLLDVPNKIHCKVILFQHNIEYLTMRSVGIAKKSFVKKFIYYMDSYRLWLYETIQYRKRKFSAIGFVSTEDRAFFDKKLNFNKVPTFIMPIGADSHFSTGNKRDNNVIIVGKMSYAPNIEGVLWFVNNIWNNVVSEVPDAVLYIIGKDPAQSICSLARKNIVVTGTVESVEKYYNMASVAAIPLFSGGGVKTKLIEAASYNIPIVCTTSSASGTKFLSDEHILISDDPKEFGRYVISALTEKEESLQRARRCYEQFEKLYQWKNIIKDLVKYVGDL